MKYPNVIQVKTSDNYNVIVTFENGEIKRFDVKPYIRGEWFGKLKNKADFETVRPCGNTIEWSGGQDIAPHELYELSNPV
ncbi:MAG: DUF2442 domain-containing protein [Clostridiales bacterium]|nr:DUF2442 domain-containing protein [Clostridiales bacterium]